MPGAVWFHQLLLTSALIHLKDFVFFWDVKFMNANFNISTALLRFLGTNGTSGFAALANLWG